MAYYGFTATDCQGIVPFESLLSRLISMAARIYMEVIVWLFVPVVQAAIFTSKFLKSFQRELR
jgi:hypothetical protein